VVATLRTPSLDHLRSRYSSSRLRILELDVSQPSQISFAFAEAIRAFDRIDVVFNNAGVGLCAEIEAAPETRNRQFMEVNFWGALAVSQHAVQCFRDANPPGIDGRLIQSSSFSGVQSWPGFGMYCASKFGQCLLFLNDQRTSTDISSRSRFRGLV
jgi:NAD(P)-dependent dehydrogenase (short-subunit alcohol dehydrogenase family)